MPGIGLSIAMPFVSRSGSGAPVAASFLLLEDSVSYLLLEDGVSRLILG